MRRSLIPGVVLAEGRSRVMRFLLGRAGVLHIRGRRLRGRIPSFPHDSALFLEGYSGVVLKAWGVKVVVMVCSGGSGAPPPPVVPHGGTASRMS